jgi:formate dehydrogenase subunit gamma
LWGGIRAGAQGNVTIPDKKSGVLVQSGGETWRNFRNGPLVTYGAYAMAGMLALLGLFFLVRGRIKIESGWSGRTIERFSDLDRTAHWMMAVSFIILGLTGLNVLYGRYVLLPVIGKDAFAAVSGFGKWMHNYVAFAFMLSLALSFILWVKHNFPNKHDVKWIAQGGGMFSKHGHPPAKKFNAGQKILFWMIMLGGLSISMSGWALLNPFQSSMFAKTFGFLNIFGLGLPSNPSAMQEMQFATLWHSIMGIFLVCVILAHIYIGTLGMQGAFDAMGSGRVDENWAKEHHSVWAEEELAKTVVERTGHAIKPQPAE